LIVRAARLRKSYGTDAVAVSHAEFTLESREFVSIVGRSGSGKSTLLAMIGGLTRPTAGQVLLDDRDIWALPEAELADLRCREFGFVFQFPSLLPNCARSTTSRCRRCLETVCLLPMPICAPEP
jgi:ABC-type lipoprotein export system ATPase subunit